MADKHPEPLAQLERLMATGLLHHFGTRITANEAHEAMGDVVPRALAALSVDEKLRLAHVLERYIGREPSRA